MLTATKGGLPDALVGTRRATKEGDAQVLQRLVMGLLQWVGSFRSFALWGRRQFAGSQGVVMKMHSLRKCINTLERVRDAYSGQLSASVLAELDDVIFELKRLANNGKGEVKLGNLSRRALKVISLIVSLVGNLTDLMK